MRTLCGDLARRGDPFEFLRNLLSHCTFSDDRDYRDDLFAGDEGAGIDGLILDDGRWTSDVGRWTRELFAGCGLGVRPKKYRVSTINSGI